MNKVFIRKINKFIRDKRPYLDKRECCAVFQDGDLLEIGFLNKQCRNDLNGSCLMCDYGRLNGSVSIQTYLDEMRRILREYNSEIKFLLICSNGSILDEYQVSTELLIEILKISQNCTIPNVIIETHYRDVTIERLELIKNFLHKPIIIEMGLETINSKYQGIFFMKGIDMKLYEETINRIQSYGYDIEINLMLGLPFLSAGEQFEDIKKSIEWVFDKGCTPVIFPINIKPHTMLRYIYDIGLYSPISIWMLIILLDSLKPEILKRIIIAWYGNRDEPYPEDTPTIMPQTCDKCKEKIADFGRQFLNSEGYRTRKSLITELINNTKCSCYISAKQSIIKSGGNFDDNYNVFYQHLKKDFKYVLDEVETDDKE